MSKTALGAATIDELVERFANLCIAQDRELLRGDVPRINKLFDDIQDVKQELKVRPGDQRRALISLYHHDNMQVRLKAATATLAVAPDAARNQLEEIRASNWQPQSGEASGTLRNLHEGIFKPT
jgi:hypothetical protein